MGNNVIEITNLVAKWRQVKSTVEEQSKAKVGFDVMFFEKLSDLNIYKTKQRVSKDRHKLKI